MVAAAATGNSRKEKRKLERNEKKQRKNKQPRIDAGNAKAAQQKPSQHPKGFANNRTNKRTSSSSSSSSNGGIQNKFHELVQETTGLSMRGGGERAALSREDAEIKALETKLGLKSSSANKKDGLKRLQKEFVKDGLGEDFTDFLSSLDNISSLVKERKRTTTSSSAKGTKETKRSKAKQSPVPAKQRDESEEDEDEDEDEDGNEEDEWPSDMEMDDETRREFALLQQEDAEFLAGMDELPTDESDLDDDDEDLAAFESEEDKEEEEDEEDEDEEVQLNTLRNSGGGGEGSASEEEYDDEDIESDVQSGMEEESADGDDDEGEEEEEDEEEKSTSVAAAVEIKEDIYGRPVLQADALAKKPSAYVPPHLRRQMEQAASSASAAAAKLKAHLMPSTMDEQALRELTRRVNGQLNRISETNMESITLEMEKIYREYGRSIVNSILLDKLLQISVHPTQVMTPFIKVGGALVAALYHSVGSEVGGFFMEKFVLQLLERVDDVQAKVKEAQADGDEENDPTASKEPTNLMLLVAMLYNFGVVQCTLIYDLFRRFVDHFSPVEIELIHQLLKSCGHQLRADDADALKEMVSAVQTKVASSAAGVSKPDERVRFILDLIYDLKKPAKHKHTQKGGNSSLNAMSASMDLSSLKKWLGRVKSRCGNANNALRVSLHEVVHANENGRWWVVGGTWVGYQQAQVKQTHDASPKALAASSAADKANDKLLALADKQRMNTDVRKRIFVAIMGASDCLDAYERLLQLHLKEKQEREIVRVVVHCCGSEKKFNRYYLLLSAKLCELDPRYKFTFQLAFWDTFKQLETLPPRKLFNLAQLLAGLMINGALSLSCLKVIDFTSMDEKTVLFVRLVVEKIMLLDDEAQMAQVFQRLLQTKKAMLTIDGLAVFMHQHVAATHFKSESDPQKRLLLKQRSKSVKSLLDALAKSAASTESMKDFM